MRIWKGHDKDSITSLDDRGLRSLPRSPAAKKFGFYGFLAPEYEFFVFWAPNVLPGLQLLH